MANDTDQDFWQQKLTADQFRILRGGETEMPFSGALLRNKEKGLYSCAGCDYVLFKSDHKFDSGSGWPSFYDIASGDSVTLRPDNSLSEPRVEVLCRNCEGHLGHVFDDAYDQPTKKRYCINSLSLNFKKDS